MIGDGRNTGVIISAKTALNENQAQRIAESDGREIETEELVVLISGVFHAAYLHELPAFQREAEIQGKSELSPSLGDSPKSIEAAFRAVRTQTF